jgi:uncharacterized protein (DUF362 family)
MYKASIMDKCPWSRSIPPSTSGHLMNGDLNVLLERCVYTHTALSILLERMSPFLGIAENLRGTKVLLKPNLISAHGPALACTDPRFIAAVAGWFVDHGAVVCIGDSPAFGSAAAVLKRLGVHSDLIKTGVQVVEFTTSREFILADGVRIGVAAQALDCDLLVNLPKIKAHNQMYMTIAVKNIFGIVKGLQKSLLHMRYGDSHHRFAKIILALVDLLPENITIADGITAMHTSGPLHGRPLALQCVAGSVNTLAVDTAILAALELAPDRSPLWLEAGRRKCPGAQLAEIKFPFLQPSDFHGSGFMAPDLLFPVRFNPFRFLHSTIKRMILALRS